jgi:hypothetical protein
MATLKKVNRNLVFRLLLVAGYFVLFATQFNTRYYTTANFFVYGSSGAGAANQQALTSPVHRAQGQVEYRKTTHDNSHLSISKRFRFQPKIKLAFICLGNGRPSFPLLEKNIYSFTPDDVSSDLLTNALRGPPCA